MSRISTRRAWDSNPQVLSDNVAPIRASRETGQVQESASLAEGLTQLLAGRARVCAHPPAAIFSGHYGHPGPPSTRRPGTKPTESDAALEQGAQTRIPGRERDRWAHRRILGRLCSHCRSWRIGSAVARIDPSELQSPDEMEEPLLRAETVRGHRKHFPVISRSRWMNLPTS